MNDTDKENLAFILTNDAETLKKWYDSLSTEDIEYAFWLIKTARVEMTRKQVDYMDQADSYDDLDCTEADLVLSKFKL